MVRHERCGPSAKSRSTVLLPPPPHPPTHPPIAGQPTAVPGAPIPRPRSLQCRLPAAHDCLVAPLIKAGVLTRPAARVRPTGPTLAAATHCGVHCLGCRCGHLAAGA